MQYDVVISGGGLVGATLACLLADGGQRVAVLEAMSIMPAEPFDATTAFSLRVSALSRASQQVLTQIGVWSGVMARRCQAYQSMVVWDAAGTGKIRFDAAELGEPELGHIVENAVVQQALLARIRCHRQIDWYSPAQLRRWQRHDQRLWLTVVTDGHEQVLDTGLLVGADGAHSRVRELAGIGWQQQDYGQSGLVAVVRTSVPHQDTAWQRFLPSGPLAFLPLSDPHYCSIVWTLPADRVSLYLRQSEATFCRELATALEDRLGPITECSQRVAFPLGGGTATDYVQANLALVGDAAHTIHPLAGQGVNLGIKDALVLAELLVGQAGKTVDYRLLRRYERARRGDNHVTQKVMEGFNLCFSNSVPHLVALRNLGLSHVNKSAVLKKLLARQAMGV